MKKERTLFDAIAEELDEPKPEPKKPRKTLTAEAQARVDALVESYKREPAPESWSEDKTTPEPEFKFPPPPAAARTRSPLSASSIQARRERLRTPSAYLSAMGKMFPLEDYHTRSRSAEDIEIDRSPYGARLDRTMVRVEVTAKLSGYVDEDVIRNGDPAIVIMRFSRDYPDPEPLYLRLTRINKITFTQTATESYTTIEAEARQLA